MKLFSSFCFYWIVSLHIQLVKWCLFQECSLMENWKKRKYFFRFVACHQRGEQLKRFLLLVIPASGRPVEACAVEEWVPSRADADVLRGFSVRPVWQPSVAGKSMNFGARQTCFFVLFFYSIFTWGYFFIAFRDRGREKERERVRLIYCLLYDQEL